MRSDIQKLLFEMRERPNDFQMDEFCLMHVPTRQEIWVCSGFGFYGLYRGIIYITPLTKPRDSYT
jgi:hypothetical protein